MAIEDALATGASLINPALGVGVKLAGAAFNLFGNKKKSKQEEAIEKAVNDLIKVGVPPAEALAATYQRYQSAGELTPELEQTFTLADTELKKVEEDPELRDLQRRAIEGIRREAESTGITLESRAALDQALGQADQRNRGQQGAILQNLAARGTLSAGDELVQRQMAQQQAAEAQRQSALDAAARSEQARRSAILNLRQQAGAMSQEDIRRQETLAAQQDAINRFNVSNQQDTAGSNVNRRNTAQQLNLAQRQDLLDKNVGLSNRERDNMADAIAKNYDARLAKAREVGNLRIGGGQVADTRQANRTSGISKVVSGAGDLLANTDLKKLNPFSTSKTPRSNLEISELTDEEKEKANQNAKLTRGFES